MEKYVIYKDLYGYKLTTEANYNARIQDARKIISLNDCENMSDAITLVKMFCSLNDENIIKIGE